MKRPKMLLFDYGQTLIAQAPFDGVRGTAAVLEYASVNRHHYSAEEVQREADAINRELGRQAREGRHLNQTEVPNHMFTGYLYESLGITLSLSAAETDRVFWDAAAPGTPTEGMEDFLSFLKNQGIRTGVISNLCFCGKVLEERIDRLLPDNEFEFILASSEYLFRKPNRRIFELALEKAQLEPGEVWYIGDDYECDVEGARSAGIFPVWYVGALEVPYVERENVLTVWDWKELEGLLCRES